MSNLPLNAVENTRDGISQSIDAKANLSKSPYKLTMTEKRVIGGLKQLTESLFKQYFKQNENDENSIDGCSETLQSDEVAIATAYSAPNNIENHPTHPDKENNGHFQQFLDNAMQGGAEQFCAMVVEHLTAGNQEDQSEEWHRDQLNAYNMAHERLFEKAD